MEVVALDVETANRFRTSVCAIAIASASGARTWYVRPEPGRVRIVVA
jgi:hypothetical protein